MKRVKKEDFGVKKVLVVDINKKLDVLKIELDKKVKALIGEGITLGDPLVERQNNISQLLSLRSEIFGLNLRKKLCHEHPIMVNDLQ